MRKYSLLISAAMFLTTGAAAAADDYSCATPPTCAELGYTDTAANCAGKKMLKCPFDATKVYCGGADCPSMGYTGRDQGAVLGKCTSPSERENCPYDSSYYRCVSSPCVDDGYTLTGSGKFCPIGSKKVTCPSDSSYYKCEVDCPAAGYTYNCGLAGCKGNCLLVGTSPLHCPADTSYYKCQKMLELVDSCSSGFLSSDPAACQCQYGIKANGTTSSKGNTCYRCGTYDECGRGPTMCIMCTNHNVKI